MKTTYKGFNIECTPEELDKLLALEKKTTTEQPQTHVEKHIAFVKKVKVAKVAKKNTSYGTHWSQPEIGLLTLFWQNNFANKRIGWGKTKELQKLLPGRTLAAISAKAFEIGLSTECTKVATAKAESKPVIVKKRKSINTLLAQQYGPSDTDKVSIAKAAEVTPQKKLPPAIAIAHDPDKPKIASLDTKMNDIFVSMLSNVIANKSKLNYYECQYAIGIHSPFFWREFCTEFMKSSQKFAAYFNVDNKFKLLNEGPRIYITYG